MAKETRSPEALTLFYLRAARGWTQKELAAALGFADEKRLCRYEKGDPALTRAVLDTLVAPLGFSPEAVDALLFAHRLVSLPPEELAEEAASPVPLTPGERERISRTAMAAGWSVAESLRAELTRQKQREKADAAAREAEELFQRLLKAPPGERRQIAQAFPAFHTPALAVRACEASLKAVADQPEKARELAELALAVAERVGDAGGSGWRPRLQGYCWAHLANAHRVATDFDGAHAAFARAWELWQAGKADPDWLPEWRLLSLEASLRREQRRFPEALELLDRASALSGGDPAVMASCLLTKERVCEAMGDISSGLAALAEAAPFVEASGDTRLLFAHRFNTTDNLCHVQRFAEAAERLPEIGELALQQGAELDGLRVAWLGARVAAGQGKKEEAVAGLEWVRRRFTAMKLPYEAALSSLELAVLWLEAGRTAEVRELAVAMAWIFKAKGIGREALAALQLFREAAGRDAATVELARRAIAGLQASPRTAQGEARGAG